MPTRPSGVPAVPLTAIARQLGAGVQRAPGTEVVVSGISLHSGDVHTGDLYAALPGAATHGARFAAAAVASGAVAVLTDARGAALIGDNQVNVPVVVVERPRAVLAELSADLYDHPAEAFATVGITGTQGKTTTTYLAQAALGDHRSAVVGTIGTQINRIAVTAALTTPEAPALQALFAVMRAEQVEALVMEVSSHALVQGRVDGFTFDVSVFLNLGRDHLDFHDTVEEYYAAKATLFTPEHAKHAVINIDDGYGARLAAETALATTSYSTSGADADWRATDLRERQWGTDAQLHTPDGSVLNLSVPLLGTFNVSNAVAAIASLTQAGFEPAELAEHLASSPAVPGRMQRIENDRGLTAVVDYAHKPDAVAAVLDALRPVTAGRLIIVIGAGGDRDRGKRPLMGQAAAAGADVVIVTDDNPRSEDPAAIRAEVLVGTENATAEVHEIAGRSEAISYAVARAKPSDTVVVAGKGHERGQQIGHTVHPFDDAQQLRQAMEAVS